MNLLWHSFRSWWLQLIVFAIRFSQASLFSLSQRYLYYTEIVHSHPYEIAASFSFRILIQWPSLFSSLVFSAPRWVIFWVTVLMSLVYLPDFPFKQPVSLSLWFRRFVWLFLPPAHRFALLDLVHFPWDLWHPRLKFSFILLNFLSKQMLLLILLQLQSKQPI